MSYSNAISRNGVGEGFIPPEYVNEIIQGLPQSSVALSKFRTVRMSRKVQRQPVLSTLPQAYFVSGDTGLKQTAAITWGTQDFVAEEIAVIVPIPEAVLADSEFDIWGEIRPLLVQEIGATIDAAVLFGVNKPASWPAAVVPGAVASGNVLVQGAVTANDLAEDINGVMGLVEADGFAVNGFIAAQTLKSRLRGLRDKNNNPIFSPSLTAGTPAVLYGEAIEYPMNGAFDGSQAALIAGDFTKGLIAIRQDITYKMLDQAVISNDAGAVILNLAQQDAVAMRVVMRLAYQVAKPLSRFNAANGTRYPFGVMRPVGYV